MNCSDPLGLVKKHLGRKHLHLIPSLLFGAKWEERRGRESTLFPHQFQGRSCRERVGSTACSGCAAPREREELRALIYSSESQSLKSTLSLGPPFILLLFFFFLLCFYRGRSLLLRRRFSQRSSRHPVSIPLDFDIEIQNQSVWIIYLLDRQAIIIRPYVPRSLIYFLILSFPSGQQTTGNYNLTGGQAFRVGHDFYIRAAIGERTKEMNTKPRENR